MQTLDSFDQEQVSALLEKGEFFWLDLHKPEAEALDELATLLNLHPLAAEDLQKGSQRPKLDDYDGYALMVFYGVSSGDGVDRFSPHEVHLLISEKYLVTVHHGELGQLSAVRQRLKRLQPEGPEAATYRILDALTDSFFPVLEKLDDEIDTLEDLVVERPTEQQLQRLFELKRQLVRLRRVVAPQRDLLASSIDVISDIQGIGASAHNYFRDVYDHMIRISDLIDTYRDLLSGALDVYLSTVSNRLNSVMERLTVVATIFLPLMFITGYFGMNFNWMIKEIGSATAFLVLGVGLVFIPVLWMTWYMRKNKYL